MKMMLNLQGLFFFKLNTEYTAERGFFFFVLVFGGNFCNYLIILSDDTNHSLKLLLTSVCKKPNLKPDHRREMGKTNLTQEKNIKENVD